MTRFLISLIISFLCMSSCGKQDDELKVEPDEERPTSYVYRERDNRQPLVLALPRERPSVSTRVVEMGFDEMLGRSFKLDFFPFECMLNIGEPVVNMEKLNQDHPTWAAKSILRQNVSHSFSYSSFQRYEEKSSSTTKVSSGFELNLGIFKIGNKKTYYKHFASTLLENSNSVFGQLDIEIQDANYNLAVNSNRLKQIRKDYLKDDFIDDLYNLSVEESFSFYGPFVISGFVTGGKSICIICRYN